MFYALIWIVVIVVLAPAISLAQAAAVVSGRVLALANGMPVGYASVVIENAATGTSVSGALTGEDGRFVVQGLAPGTYTFRVTSPGFLEAQTDVLVSPLNNT
jgi:hypothetical protein